MKIQSVPQSKHSVSVIKTSQLVLYKEIMVVCSQIHTKHIHIVCGQKVECVKAKPGGIGPSGRAVLAVGLRPLTCWDCGFESNQGHGYMSVVSVLCCQVEVSATS
jgi:hypothetical protein